VKPETVINMIASGVLAAGVSCFMILLYRTEGVTQRWPIVGNAFLRLSLTATAAGALFNCLTASTPPPSEILLNCGLAGLFVWAVIFHSKLIKKDLHGPADKYHSGIDASRSGQAAGAEGSNE
jgi:hypothetical protein